MIEVDPQLFIKCRLCLEDSGTYQIDPSIREQIRYCFEINVEPYDGLSQLICKKCQSTLSDYSKIKRTFIGKQAELRKRIQSNNSPQNIAREDFEPTVKNENLDSANKPVNYDQDAGAKVKKRRISVSSVSSLGSVHTHRSENELKTKNSNSLLNEINEKQDWKQQYRKTFVCRMCNAQCFSRELAEKHKAKHELLKSKYAFVLNDNCVVELPKIDSKPNITGSMDQVVFSKNKIIAKGNSDYYVAYIGDNCIHITSDNESINLKEGCNLDEGSDSSYSNNVIKKYRRRKRRRICSRSSNETVVLENKSTGKSQESECISIDDTDSDDGNKKKLKTNVTEKNLINSKKGAVAKLVTTTRNKYLKKHEKPEKPSSEQLNRKIISIGRQIINKRNFNCTRVMKYMEHMNLNVIWLSRSPLNVTNNSNYFKIIPRLRYPSEKNINNFAGYSKKYEKPIKLERTNEATLLPKTDVVQKSKLVRDSNVIIATNTVAKSRGAGESGVVGESGLFEQSNAVKESTLVAYGGEEGRNDTVHSNISKNENTTRVCSNATTHSETRKILNSNPVANPKQLPKKFISNTKKDKAKSASSMSTLEVNADELSDITFSGFENNIQMPVITFTTSLAVPQDQIALNADSSTNLVVSNITSSIPVISNGESAKPAPRIKVKPVAELMSTETLNRMQQPSAEDQPMTQNGTAFSEKCTDLNPGYNCDDYVILDTVELPNTKTSSPFRYFRSLLQVHNLTLLDTDVTLSGDFNTLIKFKVLYKQETKELPVILCLSLFCAENVFCLKIKDRNEENINMTKISANWQWEILKIYRGEVVPKLLHNAQKISAEVREYTNRFLCLLKSINFVAK